MPLALSAGTRLSPTDSVTAPTLVKNVLREVGPSAFSDVITTGGGINSSATTFDVADGTLYSKGDVLSFIDDDTYEDVLVTNISTNTLTIRRAHRFTTAATHGASAVFHINVRHIPHVVNQAIADAIVSDLYPTIYAVYFNSVAPASPHDPWVALPPLFQRPLMVYQKSDTSPTTTYPLKFSYSRYIDTTFATNGRTLRIPSLRDPDNNIFIVWAQKPGIADLTTAQARAVEYGALSRLAEWEEAEASGTDTVAQGGVLAPGSYLRGARFYKSRQAEIIDAEAAVLDNLVPRAYPTRWIGVRHHVSPRVR